MSALSVILILYGKIRYIVCAWQVISSKPESLPLYKFPLGTLLRQAPSLLANTGLKNLPETNTLSYMSAESVTLMLCYKIS